MHHSRMHPDTAAGLDPFLVIIVRRTTATIMHGAPGTSGACGTCKMDVEGAGAVSLCEFKAAILGRRKEIIEQYNMRKNSASPTTTNGESTRSLPSTESNDSVIHEESKGEDTKRTAEVGNGHVAPGDGAVRTESRTAGDQSVGGDRSMGTGEEVRQSIACR